MATVSRKRTEAKIQLDGAGTSDVIEFWDDISTIVVTISFPEGTGTAKLQTSTSIREDLQNDNAVWVDWSNGEVTTDTQDSADAPNAIRLVNIDSQPALLEVRGNYAG